MRTQRLLGSAWRAVALRFAHSACGSASNQMRLDLGDLHGVTLALDRAGGEPAQDVALDGEIEEHRQDREGDAGRHQHEQRRVELGDQRREAKRGGIEVAPRDQRRREQIFVPAEEEGDDADRDEARPGQRQHDPPAASASGCSRRPGRPRPVRAGPRRRRP